MAIDELYESPDIDSVEPSSDPNKFQAPIPLAAAAIIAVASWIAAATRARNRPRGRAESGRLRAVVLPGLKRPELR